MRACGKPAGAQPRLMMPLVVVVVLGWMATARPPLRGRSEAGNEAASPRWERGQQGGVGQRHYVRSCVRARVPPERQGREKGSQIGLDGPQLPMAHCHHVPTYIVRTQP